MKLPAPVLQRSTTALLLALGVLLTTSCGPMSPPAPGETVKPMVLSGIVHDTGQQTVAQARVYFTSGPAPLPDVAALTNDAGMFTLSVPAQGAYTLECAADGFVTARIAVDLTIDRHIEIELEHVP